MEPARGRPKGLPALVRPSDVHEDASRV